jgi:lauroyl/myristoyl acyltransferase
MHLFDNCCFLHPGVAEAHEHHDGAPRMKPVTAKDFYYLCAITLVKLMAFFPSPRVKELVATALGSIAYASSFSKRRVMETNLTRCFFQSLDEDRQRKILLGAFSGVWRELFSWSLNRAELRAARETEIEGLKHLQEALELGKGVILWESNGFGRRLLAKRILHAKGFPLHQVHGPNHLGGFLTKDASESWLRRRMIKGFFRRCEQQFCSAIVDLPGSGSLAFARTLQKFLSRNSILIASGDGRVGERLIPIDFLGQPVHFATGMVSLARWSGAVLLPIFCVPGDTGAPLLVIEKPIRIDQSAGRNRALESAVRRYATLLEDYIRRYPELYRNWHLLAGF